MDSGWRRTTILAVIDVDEEHRMPRTPDRSGAPLAAAAGLVALLTLAVLALLAVAPPDPRDETAPAADFSAARAAAHVERIAAVAHPTGSPAAGAALDHVTAALRAQGVRPEVQTAVGLTAGPTVCRARNVIGVLPGTASTGRVLLVAHYDSVPMGPGASDDASGVATVLETVRALRSGPALRNDVVVLITDAEEAGLCGAEAFLAQHPLARDGGVVLNLDSRGSSGPPIMFRTSPGNAALVDVFGRAAPHPVAASTAVEVYRRLPNNTDLTEFLATGRFTGLDFAHIDGSVTYHSPQDTPARLDRGTLQAQGDTMLAVTRELGAAADLPALARPAASDATYFTVPGMLVRYPQAVVGPLAALAVLATAAFGWRAVRKREASRSGLLAGVGLALVPLLGAPAAAYVLWRGVVALRPGYADMLDPWTPGPYRLAVVALAVAVVLAGGTFARRRVGAAAAWFGTLVWAAALGAGLAAFVPGASYLAAVPALAGAVAAIATLGTGRPGLRSLTAAAGAAVAVAVLVPTVALFFPALGMPGAAAPAFLTALLASAVLPAAPLPSRRPALPTAGVALVAVACVVTGLAVDTFGTDRPQPAQLMYALDADTGHARWLSRETRPGAWTSRFVTGREEADAYPMLTGELASGAAPAAPLAAPSVTVESDTRTGSRRSVTVRVRPQRVAAFVGLRVDGAVTVVHAVVAGRAVPPNRVRAGRPFGVLMSAPPAEGMVVTLVLDGTGDVRLWAGSASTGLADVPGYVPRPPGVGAAGSALSDLVLVHRTVPLLPSP